MTTSSHDKVEYWEQLRAAIVHEDNLVHHRLTWLLTIEAFLVAGFFAVQTSGLSGKLEAVTMYWLEAILIVVLVFSLWFCLIVSSMITAAYEQIALIKRAWTRKYPGEVHPDRHIGLLRCRTTVVADED